ncbi:MAG: ribonuclease P protein component [Chloroflexota bacterium]
MTATKGKGRLTRSKQYLQVYRQDRFWASPFIVMRIMRNGLAISRYGFTISKKVGHAVTRNRVRRRLGEILRLTPLDTGWDIVFVIRAAAAEVKFSELQKSVADLLARAHLMEKKDEEIRLKVN